MSLSALLLGASGSRKSKQKSEGVIDSDLDALFHSTVSATIFFLCVDLTPLCAKATAPGIATPAQSIVKEGKKKRKSREGPDEIDSREIKKSKSKDKKTSKPPHESKHVPQDETPEQRDSRTIFVGNLSVEVAQKKVCVFSMRIIARTFLIFLSSPSSSNSTDISYHTSRLLKSSPPASDQFPSKSPHPSCLRQTTTPRHPSHPNPILKPNHANTIASARPPGVPTKTTPKSKPTTRNS